MDSCMEMKQTKQGRMQSIVVASHPEINGQGVPVRQNDDMWETE
jgi:hypothetical protein